VRMESGRDGVAEGDWSQRVGVGLVVVLCVQCRTFAFWRADGASGVGGVGRTLIAGIAKGDRASG